MAARKQYELLFQLTAKLGPDFSKSFKNAQNTMKSLQSELKNADAKLKDVSAYQKQQTAVGKSCQRVNELQTEHEELVKEINKTGQATPELTKKLQANESAMKKAQDATAREEEKLSELDETLRKAGVNTDNLSQDTEELRQQYEKLETAQKKVNDITAKQEANSQAISSTKASLLGLTGVVTGVGVAIYNGPVKKAAEFQEQMSTVKALSGATADQLTTLSEKAKEMGAKTAYTATEAGEAMEYMAMAGWDTEQMLDGIEGVMNLAAASGEDLASTSDIVTDALTALGYTAADTNKFVDILAATATNSNTDVSMLGEAFTYVASTAGTLGYSAEDLSIALGTMANSGVKGSQAGTALKTALARMAAPTDAVASAMDSLGISMTDSEGNTKSLMDVMKNLRSSIGSVNVELTDSDGNLRSYEDIIDDLSKTTEGLSQVQQIEAASTIFGKNAMAGMLTIVNATDSDFQSLTDSIYDSSGAAAEMAGIKLDNLNGDITLMKSAWDALNVTLGEMLIPNLRSVVTGITGVINKVNDFAKANPGTVKMIATMATALVGLKAGGLVAKLGFLEVKGGILSIKKAFAEMKGLGISKYLGSLTGGFAGIKNVGNGILGYFKNIKSAAGGVNTAFTSILSNSSIFTKIGGFFSSMGGKISGAVMGAGSKVLNLFLSPFGKIGSKLGNALSGLGGVIMKSPIGKIGSLIGAGFGKITSFIAPVGNAIKTMLGPLGKLTGSIFGPLGGVVGKILPIVGVITAIITAVQLIKSHLQEIRAFIEKTFGSGALAVFDKIVAVITNIGDTIKSVFSEGNIGQARTKIQELFGDKGTKIFDSLVNILGKVKTAVSEVINFINANVVPVAENILQVIINDVVPGIIGFVQAAAPTIMQIIQSIVDFVAAVIPIIADFIARLMPVISQIVTFLQTYVLPIISELFGFITSTVLPAISAAVQAILPVVTNVLSTLLPAIQTALTTIWNIVAPIVQGILQVVQTVMPVILSVVQSVIDSIQGVIQSLSTVLSGIIDFVTGVFTGNWSQAWNGIKQIFSGAVGGLGEIIKAPLRAVVSAVNTVISGLNNLKVPDWVPGLGGMGINIPLIPEFAKGTNYTPDTFIAGEQGPELITGAAGRKVFTAAQTGQIFSNMSQAENLNTASNVAAGMSGAGTITISVTNNPTVNVNGNADTVDIKAQLEQYDETFLEKIRQIIVSILKEQEEQKGRVAYA